jgi:hypothetical protein
VDHPDPRVDGGLNVLLDHAGEPADGRIGRLGDAADGLELRVGVDREPRLDDGDAQVVEGRGYLSFLLGRERRSRRLLTVAQRRVEDADRIELVSCTQRALEELVPPDWLPTSPGYGTSSRARAELIVKRCGRTGVVAAEHLS